MNGFGYALFGVPPADLETTWRNETDVSTIEGASPLLARRGLTSIEVCNVSSSRNKQGLNLNDFEHLSFIRTNWNI